MAKQQDAPQQDEVVHHASQRSKRKKDSPAMQPPLTPMIDVTFQLLLFFLLTCEFRETEGLIPGTLPAKGNVMQNQEIDPPPDPIRIRIRPSMDRTAASYELTGVSVVISTPAELHGHLKARQDRLGSKDVPVIILPTSDVPWEFVVEAFNQAKRAEFNKIGFAQQVM